MTSIFKLILAGTLCAVAGTTTGGLISLLSHGSRIISFAMEFTAGLIVSVVCFNIIPHCIEASSFIIVFISLCGGIAFSLLLQEIFKYNKNPGKRMLATGILAAIAAGLHNFPEGLAVGSGYNLSISLGRSMLLAIYLHNIPEGPVLALSLKSGGASKSAIIISSILTGLPFGIGIICGSLIGYIAPQIISAALSFSGGALLYIAVGDLIPESKRIYIGRRSAVWNIAGLLCGIFINYFF